jgi:hypothetical protein
MSSDGAPTWSFLTNHARVLLCIAQDPGIRLREIGDRVGITERAAYNIVTEFAAAGYISRQRRGRRNHYTIDPHLPLPDRLAHKHRIRDLLAILTTEDPTWTNPASVQRQRPEHSPGTRPDDGDALGSPNT